VSRKTPSKDAYAVVSRLIDSYLDVGQPHTECSDKNHPEIDSCRSCNALGREITKLRDRFRERSKFTLYTDKE